MVNFEAGDEDNILAQVHREQKKFYFYVKEQTILNNLEHVRTCRVIFNSRHALCYFSEEFSFLHVEIYIYLN